MLELEMSYRDDDNPWPMKRVQGTSKKGREDGTGMGNIKEGSKGVLADQEGIEPGPAREWGDF